MYLYQIIVFGMLKNIYESARLLKKDPLNIISLIIFMKFENFLKLL